MKIANTQSKKTTINLSTDVKRKALELAKLRFGDSGNLSLLISELIKTEYANESDVDLESESVADSLKRAARKKARIEESSRKASRKLGA